MIELDRNQGEPVVADLHPHVDRTTDESQALPHFKAHSVRCLTAFEGESASRPEKSGQRNWEMLIIWSFVVVSFAVFFFCFWAIRAKCRGDWPF